jgi:hypothetical protein
MFHRTAIAVLLPKKVTEQKDKQTAARFLIGLSGLRGQQLNLKRDHTLDDALQTVAQLVGIQLRQNGRNGQVVFSGESLEQESPNGEPNQGTTVLASDNLKVSDEQDGSDMARATSSQTGQQEKEGERTLAAIETKQSSQVSKFRMIILPRAAGCQPFEWRATAPYFGLTASQPVIEEPVPRGKIIRVFPCGIRDQVIELSWYQSHARSVGLSSGTVVSENVFGGALKFLNDTQSSLIQDIPLFLVGPQALALDSLPMRLESFSDAEVNNVFDADPGNPMEKEMLARVLNLNAQMQGAQMSAHTLVYFFREPISR